MADITKKMLADSMRNKMMKKPLDKITIKEIVEDCGVNRQTFYYHFPDIYGLLEWMFQQDAAKLLERYNNLEVWQEGFMELLHYMKENRAVCMCAINSMARDQLEHFVYTDAQQLILSIMNEVGGDLTIKEDDLEFIARFYTLSLCSLVINWLKNGMKDTPEVLISKLSLIMQGNIRIVMERFVK